MNSRERVLCALNHQEPDRVPFDLSGTAQTGIHYQAYADLRRCLGLPAGKVEIFNENQKLAQVEDDVFQRLGIDTRNVAPRPGGSYRFAVHDLGDYVGMYDEFGIGRRMPKDGGLYYDLFDHPLAGEITAADVARYPLPDPADPARFVGMAERAHHIAQVEGRCVVVNDLSGGLMEPYAWLRGFQDFYTDLGSNSPLAASMLDRIVDMKLAYWEQVLPLLGDDVDVVVQCDDVAGQHAMLISPRTYRKLLKPRQKCLFEYLHAHTRAKIYFHSCGAVRPIIPDLIEVGVDILNPVQVSATGMDTAELKREFGRDIVFWGGGVDTQRVLGSGTTQEVRDEVRRRVTDLMPGGGFVFASVHNIQANVPGENVVAMWQALQECGVYA